MKLLIMVPLVLALAGCSSMSLDEQYKQAYADVVREPNGDNVARYMQLSKKMADRDMANANRAAEAATIESDKGFTEYFKKYGSDEFKKSR